MMIVSSYSSYADMAPPEQSFTEFLSEKVGEEEARKILSDFSANFTKSDYSVWQHQEALSQPYPEE